MSAIACFVREKGHDVTGSDRAFDSEPSHPSARALRAMGIRIVPQDGSGLDGSYDFMVMSTAVEQDRPEVVKADALGIPVKSRPEYLASIIREHRTIAVSGTSGKSTASGMLAFVMRELGMEPNFLGGGRVKGLRGPHNPGNFLAGGSRFLVAEACESDGTIVNYRPEHTIVLNLALDHHEVDKTAGMFTTLMGHTPGLRILNSDDPNLSGISPAHAVTFSIHAPARYRATNIVPERLGSSFTVGRTAFRLSVPGIHNIYNALSVIAVLSEMGLSPADIARPLEGFAGLERRFDVHLDDGAGLVIDDYAHNPHKIGFLMETARGLAPSICYVFQPHGFAPTRLMKDDYIRTFSENLRDTDRLLLLPIFYAGGTVAKDISSEDLAAGVRFFGRSAETVRTRRELLEQSGRCDAWIVMGARDESLSVLAADLARALKGKKDVRA